MNVSIFLNAVKLCGVFHLPPNAKGIVIFAIVSRGGRPDLAEKFLSYVKAPTLLIVGGNDESVIKLNRKAYNLLVTEKKLKIIPGASYLFEEPGMLEKAADLATKWFLTHNATKITHEFF